MRRHRFTMVVLLLSGAVNASVDPGGVAGSGATDSSGADVLRINRALCAWIADARGRGLFIEIDCGHQRLRLRQAGAVLRDCPLNEVRLGRQVEVEARLVRRMRRYRPQAPGVEMRSGPFDWEDVLARAAADDCALYFDNGLILFSDPVWSRAGAPAGRLAAGDLRALFEACSQGTPLVVLPQGWDQGAGDEQ